MRDKITSLLNEVGEVSKREITALFSKMPKNEQEAKKEIIILRKRFWPIGNSKDWIFKDWKDCGKEIVEFQVE